MNDSLESRIRDHVIDVPDFPKPGVRYRDITPILEDAALFKEIVDAISDRFEDSELQLICGVEARGFIFGAAVAYRLGLGFIPIRWTGKLPRDTSSAVFELEYGFNAHEVHKDAFENGRRVLVVDDLLGTGATMKACVEAIRQAGGEVVAAAIVVEVQALEGRSNLPGLEIHSLSRFADGA